MKNWENSLNAVVISVFSGLFTALFLWLIRTPIKNIWNNIRKKISVKRINHKKYLKEQRLKEEYAEQLEKEKTQRVLNIKADFNSLANNILEIKSKQRYEWLCEYCSALRDFAHHELYNELLDIGNDVLRCYQHLIDRPALLSKREKRELTEKLNYIKKSME